MRSAAVSHLNCFDKTINVLTSMRSKSGKRAIVSLHLDSNAEINCVRNVEGYDIKTMHGRDNYWSLLKNTLESDSESNPQVFYAALVVHADDGVHSRQSCRKTRGGYIRVTPR